MDARKEMELTPKEAKKAKKSNADAKGEERSQRLLLGGSGSLSSLHKKNKQNSAKSVSACKVVSQVHA